MLIVLNLSPTGFCISKFVSSDSMRATLVFVALLTVASGLPAHLKVDKLKAHESSKDILEYIESLFEKTCHNLCLKRFPEAGAAQDKCMSICRLFPRGYPVSLYKLTNIFR